MLSKCSNPSCSASFHSLENGKLFRLEPDPRTNTPKPAEYYWLCHRCASTMTLCVGEREDVIAVVLPPALQNAPGIVTFALADRKRGLRLQQVNPLFPITDSKRLRSFFVFRDGIA